MQLNTNIKISIFKKVDGKTIEDKDTFVHYWNNTEENFPDCTSIGDYLKSYIDTGNYEWAEIQDTSRFVRSKILTATLTLNNSDRLSVDQVFVKVEYTDDSEIPQYYYGTEVDVMTNQNNPTNDYTLLLELDMWSTFGCKMHGLMKDENMTQNFLCNRKMCDRFKYEVYNEETGEWEATNTYINDGKHRLGLNYMLQPWLLNSGKYDYPLIQATDDLTEAKGDITPLKLEDWLNMNGCNPTQWKHWLDVGPISVINCKEQYSQSGVQSTQSGPTGYIYNPTYLQLAYRDMNLTSDANFNSNGKYRYLVVKFGSNNTWSYKLNTDKDSPDYDEQKVTAYNNARQDLCWYDDPVAKTGRHDYTDLQQLLSDVVLGGGKQCITTKKVRGLVANTETHKPIYLNGECVCLIPIPKGQFEQLYLFYLNSHDKGIVLGDGTILGMVVNDIPPSIFAAALRKYNLEIDVDSTGKKVPNADMQTIGDKLAGSTGATAPFAWTTLRLDGQWDWEPNVFKAANIDPTTEPNDWTDSNDWYQYKVASGSNIKVRPKEYFLSEGYYIFSTLGNPSDIASAKTYLTWGWAGGNWESISSGDFTDPETGEVWSFFSIIGLTKEEMSKVTEDWSNYRMFFHFKGGNQWVKSNWEYLGSCLQTVSGALLNYNIDFAKFNYNYDGKNKWKYWVENSNLIPPIDSSTSKLYHDSQDTTNKLFYISASLSYYFPTIFHDFSYIPITVAQKKDSEIVGQGQWFDIFNNMLTDPLIYGTNNRWSDPFLWGPQFYQWVYFTDGLSKITLTADQIDWFKIHNSTWNVNLRANISSTTNLKLDIEDIINENYPFSKSASEFILSDPNKYPFTTEAYNNWYEQNAVSENTSKRAKDITNEFSQKKYNVGKWLNLFSSTTGGATAGAVGGGIGAAIGGIVGLGAGIGSMFLGQEKLNLEIQQANEQWANEWAGNYGNLYGRPAEIIADGFTSGSLLYTPNGPAKDSYELFRMFTINPEARDSIGEEIFTSGYPYMRECLYSDYDNRENFNIVNFNLDEKGAIVNNYLKREFSKDTLIFSQQQFIEWFKSKCKKKIRLFKKNFDYNNMDDLIKTNIERDMTVNE